MLKYSELLKMAFQELPSVKNHPTGFERVELMNGTTMFRFMFKVIEMDYKAVWVKTRHSVNENYTLPLM